jgi:hypothetical protein
MTTQRAPEEDVGSAPIVQLSTSSGTTGSPFAIPGVKSATYTDGRPLGDWESKYTQIARRYISQEAYILGGLLFVLLFLSGTLLGLSGQSVQVTLPWLAQAGTTSNAPVPVLNIDFRLLAIFFIGCLGGTTFSIKWLVHAAAKSKWHLDRRYWRLFVPSIGGVYACVVLTLLDGGVIGAQAGAQPRSAALTAAFAFLVGYFSDGVSGLLSNIANAVFGTLEKK